MPLKLKPLLILTLLIASCNTNKSKPEQYQLEIAKDDLVHIMIDLAIAESAAASYRVDDRDSVKNVYRYQIEQVHGIKMTKIDSTLQTLYQNTLLNQELQKRVLDSLKRLEETAKKYK